VKAASTASKLRFPDAARALATGERHDHALSPSFCLCLTAHKSRLVAALHYGAHMTTCKPAYRRTGNAYSAARLEGTKAAGIHWRLHIPKYRRARRLACENRQVVMVTKVLQHKKRGAGCFVTLPDKRPQARATLPPVRALYNRTQRLNGREQLAKYPKPPRRGDAFTSCNTGGRSRC